MPNLLSRLAGVANKALTKAGFPKVKFEVQLIPLAPWWMQRVPYSRLPEPFRSPLGKMVRIPEHGNYWLPVFLPEVQFGKCRVCRKAPGVGSLGLCTRCFEAISEDLVGEGLLIRGDEEAYSGTSEWVKLISRVRKGRFVQPFGGTYIVVERREEEFCERLNAILRLTGQELLSKDSCRWYEGLR